MNAAKPVLLAPMLRYQGKWFMRPREGLRLCQEEAWSIHGHHVHSDASQMSNSSWRLSHHSGWLCSSLQRGEFHGEIQGSTIAAKIAEFRRRQCRGAAADNDMSGLAAFMHVLFVGAPSTQWKRTKASTAYAVSQMMHAMSQGAKVKEKVEWWYGGMVVLSMPSGTSWGPGETWGRSWSLRQGCHRGDTSAARPAGRLIHEPAFPFSSCPSLLTLLVKPPSHCLLRPFH